MLPHIDRFIIKGSFPFKKRGKIKQEIVEITKILNEKKYVILEIKNICLFFNSAIATTQETIAEIVVAIITQYIPIILKIAKLTMMLSIREIMLIFIGVFVSLFA